MVNLTRETKIHRKCSSCEKTEKILIVQFGNEDYCIDIPVCETCLQKLVTKYTGYLRDRAQIK